MPRGAGGAGGAGGTLLVDEALQKPKVLPLLAASTEQFWVV